MLRSARRRTAMLAAGVLVVAGMAVGFAANPAHAAVACNVDYQAQPWTEGPGVGGFTANITINNLQDPVSGWTLQFTLPAGQQFTQGWSANWSGSTGQLTATNAPWNGNLGTGQSTSIGFNGRWSGSYSSPTSFTLNGVTCNGGSTPNQPPTVSITSPANNAQFAAPANVTVNANAADADGSIDRVEFYRNGSLVGTDTTAPYSFAHSALPAGAYVLLARAWDNDGASADAQVSISVTASTTPAVQATPNTVTLSEGGTATFAVSLTQQPASNVTVSTTRTSGSTGVTVQSGGSLTFTPANWNQSQTVTLAAASGSGGSSAQFSSTATGHTAATVTANVLSGPGGGDQVWIDRFMEQYNKIKNSGYFSPEGIPYHSIETLIVEAPDHGHTTTSEAFSFWLWLEANYGRITENWQPFNQAWQTMETYIIPSSQDQPSAGAAGDAQYAAEHAQPSSYPSALQPNVPVGQDPLRGELQSTYGTGNIYGMHWLLDVDNTYGFGRCGNGTTRPAYINTFQRGPQESVWETVPHPSCDTKAHGGTHGYMDLFITEDNAPATQWRYTNAPDADARAIQAAYWALTWATEQGNQSQISATIAKAARMGDYMRYALFDKYFKQVGNCVGASSCPAGSGRSSAHYLLSWYYAWGGSYPGNEWSWRIGSSHNHFGYQNPMSAWAMTNVAALRPQSPTALADWQNSLTRTIEFYQWLQSADGAIAGGATNSWGGSYGTPPAGTPTFYGMFYEPHPVYHDPGSNGWFGMQVWSLQRLAEYLYLTDDPRAKSVLDKWVPWAISQTTINANGSYLIPSTMQWSGAPATWNPNNPQPNNNLRVTVTEWGEDVGVTAAYARTLMWYAAATGNTAAKNMALSLIEGLYGHRDAQGVSVVETREDYGRFDDVWNSSTQQGIYIPPGWSGTMPNGDVIQPGVSFLDIRSFYLNDPDFPKVQAYLNGGPAPTFRYHRSWAQMDVAMAFADWAHLFPEG